MTPLFFLSARRLLAACALILTAITAQAQEAPDHPSCGLLRKVAALTPLAERFLNEEDHYTRITEYRTEIVRVRQIMRAAPLALGSRVDPSLIEAQIGAHADLARTAELMGLPVAARMLESEQFRARDAAIFSASTQLGCRVPGWRERAAWMATPFRPLMRIWQIEEIRPLILWSGCFVMIIWARRYQKKVEKNARRVLFYGERKILRHQCNMPAELQSGGACVSIRILNISPQGCGYALGRETDLAESLLVVLPGGLSFHARNKWLRGRHGGVQFTPALTEAELAAVLEHDALAALTHKKGKGQRPFPDPAPQVS